jgi:trehalose/maltose hydrolase-like predicted phosphorylase
MFMTALESDVLDVQGGTTQEGIHMGAMAGTLDVIQRGYVGARAKDTTLCFDPKPNERLDGLSLCMRFRETPVEVTLEGERLTVAVQADGSGRTIRAGVGERVREIRDGKGHTFPL